MARITPSPLVNSIQGSIGGVTFKKTQAGLTAQSRQVFKAPLTTFQMGAQRANSYLKNGWSILSTANQNSWNQLALQLQQNTQSNGKYPRRGYDLFLEYNWTRSFFFEALVDTAPSNYQKTTLITNLNLRAFVHATGVVKIGATGYSPALNPRTFAWCRMGQRGSRQSALCPWRYVAFTSVSSLLVDISVEYAAAFPTPTLGQLCQWKFLIQADDAFPGHIPNPVTAVLV